MNLSINSIGISLGESTYCISVRAGGCAIYLHGTTQDARTFAMEIIAAADSYDAAHPAPAEVNWDHSNVALVAE